MRLREFQDILREKNVDAALFMNLGTPPENFDIAYFSGYFGAGALVIYKEKPPLLLVPKMELESARCSRIKNIRCIEKKKLIIHLQEVLENPRKSTQMLGICFSSVTVSMYRLLQKGMKKTRIIDIGGDFEGLRSIKTKKECTILRKGFGIANRIYEKTIARFRSFKTESDVAGFLVYQARLSGAESAFPPIVASGRHASMPHYFEGKGKLQRGLCVIDFGIRYRGYCTDMTRTVAIGRIPQREKKSYSKVREVQEELVRHAVSGASCKGLYEECVTLLEKDARFFTHGLGHGIGTRLHELPNLSPNSKETLEKNMTCTIEPGMYVPGRFGIRIEDTLLIGEKSQRLTTPSKELVQVR